MEVDFGIMKDSHHFLNAGPMTVAVDMIAIQSGLLHNESMTENCRLPLCSDLRMRPSYQGEKLTWPSGIQLYSSRIQSYRLLGR